MLRELDFEIPVQHYQSPKIVPMPDNCLNRVFFPSRFFAMPFCQNEEPRELDVDFLRDVANNEACPEYNGYNTMVTRQQGVSMPKTKALIDMMPSEPYTIMTALHEAKRLTKDQGQQQQQQQQVYSLLYKLKFKYIYKRCKERRRMPFSQVTDIYIKLLCTHQ